MSRRRADDADVHGLLNVCKPRGFTSHDVVAVVRRTLHTRRVGHAGTLDPLAEGVLPVCVGRYTRLVDYVSNGDKGYYAEIQLGARTTTDDAEGEIVERLPVPPLTQAIWSGRSPAFAGRDRAGAADLLGDQGGRVSERTLWLGAATRLELEARPVTIHRLDWCAGNRHC